MSTETPRAATSEVTIVHSPRAGRALIVADALQQEADQRKLLGQYIHSHMIEGSDYGVIPGTKSKTLLKAGAEKLTQLYRCIPRFVIEEKTENWESGLFYYRFSCQIVTQADDAVVAEGVGSCSTYESRYRWRGADRKCPECGKTTIIKGKAEYGGGWLCFAKKGGCGAKFDDGDPEIIDQPTGRVQNPDLLDQVNTVLKMAKKRALVDAAIALARCSDIFTQDIEDMVAAEEPPAKATPPQSNPSTKPQTQVESYSAEIKGAQTLDALKAVVDRINAGVAAKKFAKEETNILIPLATERKYQLTAKAEAAREAEVLKQHETIKAAREAAAREGEQSADPTPAKSATTPTASTSTADSDIPTAGKAIVDAILGMLHELDLSWSEVRDGVGKGDEIASEAALPKMPLDFRVQQLSPVEASRLHAALKSRVVAKKERAAKRAENATRKQAEEAGVAS